MGLGGLEKWSVVLLLVLAVVAYGNAVTGSLALDDASFAVHDRYAGLTIADYGRFFSEDLWAASGVESGLYRPLLLVSFALDSALFGDWIPGYHLTNVILHIIATLLVYGLMRQLVIMLVTQNQKHQVGAAFWAAAMFAVHPVHTEVVNSIFNRSEILVSIGMVGGLWWFLRVWPKQTGKAWAGLAAAYFLILLCKESAVTLPALAIGLIWLTGITHGRSGIRPLIPVMWLLIPLALYLVFRAAALGPAGGVGSVDGAGNGSLIFDAGRIPQMLAVWLESLRLLVWPHPLQIFHPTPGTSPWIAGGLQLVLLAGGVFAFRHKRPGLLLGLLFFYTTLLPSSRLIGEPGMLPHVAERYLYLPSIGLSLFLALELAALSGRYRPRAISITLSCLILVFAGLTWNRNADWSGPVRLSESDYAKDPHSGRTTETLVEALLGDRQYERAEEICLHHAETLEANWFLSNSCGVAYFHLGQMERAEVAFKRAFSGENEATARFNFAAMLLREGRRSAAVEQFELSVKSENNPFMKSFRSADVLIQLHPRDRARLLEAREFLLEALELQPQFYPARRKLQELNQTLGISG